ncbi:PUA-like domain-containing protein [Geopyxis carbonaria]|nr:PUA-like domain-containing protein [Geopyxis carbonaria]
MSAQSFTSYHLVHPSTLRNPPFQPPVSTMAAEFHKRLMLKNHAASPLASAPTPAPEITPLVPPPNIITPAMLRAAKSDMLATPGISARAHGHNGLEPGAWFPDRLHALSAGAHGSTMAGIYGAGESGAFSIVANDGTGYESVDQDRGDRMKYSGSTGSGTSTSYLYDSLRTGQPVRVIRGARCRTWGPSCGYRYDGLYDVVRVNEEQPTPVFDLRRRGDQESLESICRRSPTAAQRTAWDTWDAEKRGTSTREAWR